MTALAAIHVAKKQLGLDDETYRATLVRLTGKASAADMSEAERSQVVAEFRSKGFKPVSTGARKRLDGKYAAKLQALWIAGWNLGVVRDRDDRALISFVEGRTGIEHVRFLHHHDDATKAIEALKAWVAREGGVDWRQGNHLPDWLRSDGAKIALAQWQRLAAAGLEPLSIRVFRDLVASLVKPVDLMSDRDWIPVMNALGERVRGIVN